MTAPVFNTRMTRGQTFSLLMTAKDSKGSPRNLTGAQVFMAMRADIKIAPSVQLCSQSTVLAALQLGGLGDGLLQTLVQAKNAPGTAMTIALVGDAVAKPGTMDDGTNNIVLHYLPGQSTAADMETLLAGSTHVTVLAASIVPTQVLDAGAAFAQTALKLPATGSRVGIVIQPQSGSNIGKFALTFIPSDTTALEALGDDDPWLYDVWIRDATGATYPVVSTSNLGLYKQITTVS